MTTVEPLSTRTLVLILLEVRSGGALPLLDSSVLEKELFSIAISMIMEPSLVTCGVTFKDRGAERVAKPEPTGFPVLIKDCLKKRY